MAFEDALNHFHLFPRNSGFKGTHPLTREDGKYLHVDAITGHHYGVLLWGIVIRACTSVTY